MITENRQIIRFFHIRILPPEIGDLIQLREFTVANNSLRSLPYEMGRLFQLQNLGIIGNPLPPDILNVYHEPNGLKKLLEFMLDHLNGKKDSKTFLAFYPLSQKVDRKSKN